MPYQQLAAPGRGLFAIQLAAITDLSLELSKAGDEEELLRLAAELGHERLGFDRLELKLFPDWRANNRRCPLRYYEEAECRDAAGAFLGRADRAVALLWDGERALGELGADNLPSGRPLDGGSLELLVLYARTVGHLVSRAREAEELKREATTDSLTGVMNRRVSLLFLDKQLGLASRSRAVRDRVRGDVSSAVRRRRRSPGGSVFGVAAGDRERGGQNDERDDEFRAEEPHGDRVAVSTASRKRHYARGGRVNAREEVSRSSVWFRREESFLGESGRW